MGAWCDGGVVCCDFVNKHGLKIFEALDKVVVVIVGKIHSAALFPLLMMWQIAPLPVAAGWGAPVMGAFYWPTLQR